jgi:hypothetical protein
MRFEDILYDSAPDTMTHIIEVQKQLTKVANDLKRRGIEHDFSKLGELKPAFDIATPKLKDMTYGSEEYKKSLEDLGPALHRHWELESHHPEHYENGLDGMNLMDLTEMICDWVAASKRHSDGNPHKSLEINRERFNMSGQVYSILKNTLEFLVQ